MIDYTCLRTSRFRWKCAFELLFPLIMVFAIIYFMILRPQQKRQREHEAMVNAIRAATR